MHCVIAAHAAPAERERLRDPDERQAMSASFLDATAYGVRGMIDDFLTYAKGWGFATETVSSEVHVWHGAGDLLVPANYCAGTVGWPAGPSGRGDD
jgi:hypothetical protein